MLKWSALFVFVFILAQSKAYEVRVCSEFQWSYTGGNWANGIAYDYKKFSIQGAHRLGLQTSRFPWDGSHGASILFQYFPDEWGYIGSQYFFTQFKGQGAQVHEGFLVFGLRKKFKNKFAIHAYSGVGGYIELSSKLSNYTKRGIDHCAGFGASYRLF